MINSETEKEKYIKTFKLYRNKVYNYIFKMLNGNENANDITQNVFLNLFEHWNSIEKEESLQSYIFTIARNQVYLYIRNKKNKLKFISNESTEELEISDDNALAESLENSDTKEIIIAMINSLPEDLKEIYLLREYSGFSYKEISDLTGISQENVKIKLFRIRQTLIKNLTNKLI